MTHLLPFVLLVGFSAASSVAAQTPTDVCALFSAADVTPVLGAPPAQAGRPILPGTCVWSATGISLTVYDTDVQDPAQAIQMVEVARTRVQAPQIAKEEPGLGQRAVSTFGPKGDDVELWVANGSHVWRFSVETADKRINVDTTLPRLRAMAHKALGAPR